jgi:hypothetical protein
MDSQDWLRKPRIANRIWSSQPPFSTRAVFRQGRCPAIGHPGGLVWQDILRDDILWPW